VTTGTYDRYGLTSNPFRELAAESLSDVEIYHVRTRIDEAIASIKDEVLEKENRAVVALVGPLGAGKTQRLLLAASEGRERKAFVVYFEVTQKTVLLAAVVSGDRRTPLPEGPVVRSGQSRQDDRQGPQRKRSRVPPAQ
jgi:type II secretory pathway predicted ATPase ExeA